MEGKKAVAICCLLIVLLSGHGQLQPVAAMSNKFCDCYKSCYPDCRKSLPTWVCVPKCMDNCSPNPKPAGDCDSICQPLSVCGTATGPADIEACVDHCTKNLGAANALTTADLN